MSLYTLLPGETEPQRRWRLALQRLLRRVHELVYATIRAEALEARANNDLRDHNTAHPEMLNIHSGRVAGYLIAVVVLGAVYVIDCVLFSPVAEFLAQQAFPDFPGVAFVARFVVPAAILALELLIAMQIYFARDESGFGISFRYAMFIILAFVLNVVMPAMVVATQRAGHIGVSSGDLAEVYNWQTISLAALAIAAHAAILFGGGLAHDAKAYFLFKARQTHLRRRVNHYENSEQRNSRAGLFTFNDYVQTLESYNTAYPDRRISPGPFAAEVAEWLNRRYGYAIVRRPVVPVAEEADTPTPGSPTEGTPRDPREPNHAESPVDAGTDRTPQDAEAEGENEYLRRILGARISDDDAEVSQ